MSTTSLDSIPSTLTVDVSSFKALPNSILSPASIHTDTNDDIGIDVDSSRLVRIDQFENPGLWPDIISHDFLTQIIDDGVSNQIMNLNFSLDSNNRCFSTALYTRTMANDEKLSGNW